MAYDLSHTPATGLTLVACGDCHLLNIGGFGTAERQVIFDLNDFDEVSLALSSASSPDSARCRRRAMCFSAGLLLGASVGRTFASGSSATQKSSRLSGSCSL
jgi:hypothetical protein